MISFLLAQIDDASDREYIERLFLDYHRLMFYIAKEYVADQFEKEVIIQDSFVKIIEHVERIRKIECYELPFYLVVIVRNKALDHLRHIKKETAYCLCIFEKHPLLFRVAFICNGIFRCHYAYGPPSKFGRTHTLT